MTQRQIVPGDQMTAGGAAYQVTLEDGQIRVHLPFAVDPQALSEQLVREGFPLAHEPDTPDTQGWGHDFDPDGYYPYWVFPDPDHPGCSVFAFNPEPEDVVTRGAGERVEKVALGDRSQALIARWVPVLTTLQQRTEVKR